MSRKMWRGSHKELQSHKNLLVACSGFKHALTEVNSLFSKVHFSQCVLENPYKLPAGWLCECKSKASLKQIRVS